MKCPDCGHDCDNPFHPYCTEVVIEKNAKVVQLDGSITIEPELPSFCACKNPAHQEKPVRR